MMYALWRQFNKVIVSPAPRGRLLALHAHRRRRIRAKYMRAVVVMSVDCPPNTDNVWPMLENIRDHGGMTDRALRKFCKVMRKCGVDARMEKRR